jgi:cytoskeletal protein CcmA (bactofilin family)
MKHNHRTLWSRLLLALGLVFVLAATGVQTARALEVDKDGVVAEGEVINDDLILADTTVDMAGTVNGTLITGATNVTIRGTVNGDVITGGSTVTVTGTVKGNLFIAGGTITVNGTVENSVFFAGNSLVLGPNAKISGNLYAAGYSMELQSGSSIGRDVAVAGYQVLLDGTVGRDVHASVAAFEVSGTIGRNVSVDIAEPSQNGQQIAAMQYIPFAQVTRMLPPGLHIASKAQIAGKLDYYSGVEQPSGIQSSPTGGVQYHYRAPSNNSNGTTYIIETNIAPRVVNYGAIFVGYVFNVVREFLTLLLLGALAVWLCPTLLSRTAGTLRDKPLPSLGWGFLVLVVGVVALILAGITVFLLGLAVGVVTLFGLMGVVYGIGFSAIGLAGAVFLALAQFGSKLVVALLIGDVILRLIRKDYSVSVFWPLLLGILLLTLFNAIPILGILVSLFSILFGFGAICIVFRDWWQKRRATA